MYRLAGPVARAEVQDLASDWWAQRRAVIPMVHVAPARARLQAAVAGVHAVPGQAPRAAAATTATERRAADHRAGSPAEDSSQVDNWPADSWPAAAGNRAAAVDRVAAAAAAVAGHLERSTADAAGRRISSRIALPPERPSQAPRRWQ